MARASENEYEVRRLENIRRNKELLSGLNIQRVEKKKEKRPWQKKVAVDARPSRTSARIPSIPKPQYNENELFKVPKVEPTRTTRSTRNTKNVGLLAARQGTRKGTRASIAEAEDNLAVEEKPAPPADIEELQASWSKWEATEPPTIRDDISNHFNFPDEPDFTPNKSPEEMLREGCFGGSYFRPLYSRSLGITVRDDWEELPKSWTEGLDISTYLTSPHYDPEINKYKVQAGQSIEDWEAAGWVNHRYDVRGWFQWYCRFFMGRRCEDDERQIRRWRNCAGPTGRWRLSLLRKYRTEGVKDVFDDGEDEDATEVSPVQHQTCHHWALEVRQIMLDDFWENPR